MAAKNQTKSKSKPVTKSTIIAELAEKTGLKRNQVSMFLDELMQLVVTQLGAKGPGAFSLPGLVKFKVVNKPATPERQGINPFTKEPMTFKARPASRVVKVSAFKALKDSVGK
jgi:nucleoid DNA-binding protein